MQNSIKITNLPRPSLFWILTQTDGSMIAQFFVEEEEHIHKQKYRRKIFQQKGLTVLLKSGTHQKNIFQTFLKHDIAAEYITLELKWRSLWCIIYTSTPCRIYKVINTEFLKLPTF